MQLCPAFFDLFGRRVGGVVRGRVTGGGRPMPSAVRSPATSGNKSAKNAPNVVPQSVYDRRDTMTDDGPPPDLMSDAAAAKMLGLPTAGQAQMGQSAQATAGGAATAQPAAAARDPEAVLRFELAQCLAAHHTRAIADGSGELE